MTDNLNLGKDAGRAVAINEAAIRERILKSAVPVTAWVTACLMRDGTVNIPIGELCGHYQSHCRHENCPALPRKVWIGAMKLAGFKTQSGAFAGLTLKNGRGD